MGVRKFWYQLRDETGSIIPNASVYVYNAETTNVINVYDDVENKINQPIITDSNGEFSFNVRDMLEPSGGIISSQKIKIYWTDGGEHTGYIDNQEVFQKNIYQVDETDTDTEKNKVISNQQAYNFQNHTELVVATSTLHEIYPVDYTDGTDITYNKVVSNKVFNDLWSLLASASSPSIKAEGSIIEQFDINQTGGGGTEWSTAVAPSAALYGSYYTKITHISIGNPIVQVYNRDLTTLINPSMIKFQTDTTFYVWVNTNFNARIVTVY